MTGLQERFAAELRASRWLDGAPAVVVAVSGGMDSMTLLHLVRFGDAHPRASIHAAHVDHRMREGSGADAEFVADVCTEWGVSYHLRRASAPVTSEAEGRELRYRFLEEVGSGLGPGAVTMTAHTADDQAETVLFRAARGSGPRGLAGIHPRRSPRLVRPLLAFRRSEIEAYAASRGVPFREDPTNRDLRWTRNRLRHEILPALEEAVPGAVGALAALADSSRLDAAALDELVDGWIDAHAHADASAPGALSLDREALGALSDAVLTAVLRRAVFRLGGEAGRGATGVLVRFVRTARSGRRVDAGGGVVVERHLATVRFRRGQEDRPPLPPTAGVRIDACRNGEGTLSPGTARIGTVRVAWGPSPRHGFPHAATFSPDAVPFPLLVRPWRPGDRIRLPYGRKKVKKLLLEARVPAHLRNTMPVVVDAEGTVLWVPGVTGPVALPSHGAADRSCCVEVSFDHEP